MEAEERRAALSDDFSAGCPQLHTTFLRRESASRAEWEGPGPGQGAGPRGRGRGGTDAGRRGAGLREHQPVRPPFAAPRRGTLSLPRPTWLFRACSPCPRREPEPLAEVGAASRAPNGSAVGGGLRGAARHGRGGVSSAWGRSRGLRLLLRRAPGAEAVVTGAAACRPPSPPACRRRPWRGPAAAAASADPGPARLPPSAGRGRPAFAPEPAPAPRGYQAGG